MAAAVILASLSALLEIVGIALAVKDLRSARDRLADYMETPPAAYAPAGLANASATALGVDRQNRTLEQRVQTLEVWARGLNNELNQREQQVSDRLSSESQGALSATKTSIDHELSGLRKYIEDSKQSWLASYRGPLLLGVGVVIGLAANIVSTL